MLTVHNGGLPDPQYPPMPRPARNGYYNGAPGSAALRRGTPRLLIPQFVATEPVKNGSSSPRHYSAVEIIVGHWKFDNAVVRRIPFAEFKWHRARGREVQILRPNAGRCPFSGPGHSDKLVTLRIQLLKICAHVAGASLVDMIGQLRSPNLISSGYERKRSLSGFEPGVRSSSCRCEERLLKLESNRRL